MDSINIGIIGLGYVGKACESIFSHYFNTYTFDINGSGSENSLKKLVDKVDIIFICVPTPMNNDSSCNLTIVEKVLCDINDYKNSVCIIKSTIPPGSSAIFEKKFKNLKIYFNPEFLTEANFIEDFKNQNRIIIGSSDSNFNIIEKIYQLSFPNAKLIKSSFEEAEMVKYFINAFLCVKVSYANELFNLCDKMNIDYNKVSEIAQYDDRLGNSHFKVPGPDGKFGFGGSCFPKDINSLMHIFNKEDIKSYILKAAWDRNVNEDRTNRDWEQLIGRAVFKNEAEKI
jgi:UDPglucose 6-dehydrogenase